MIIHGIHNNHVSSGVLLLVFLSTAIEWFPRKKGLAAGASALGSGMSGCVFSAVQAGFINPWNYLPDTAPYPVGNQLTLLTSSNARHNQLMLLGTTSLCCYALAAYVATH